jgi:hypothetical protein
MLEKRETQMDEREEIGRLYESLLRQNKSPFPQPRQTFDVPVTHGVYVIYQGENVLHVGRTVRGEHGLRQRLKNHLQGKSSFARKYLSGDGSSLRDNSFSFQFLEASDRRKRALLEALAIGKLCPKHIGIGIVE